MPKSLEKTRKKIAKKKGNITALHENSRDSQRLRRAGMRDDKLIRVASARKKNDKPLSTAPAVAVFLYLTDPSVVRAAYFKELVADNDSKPLELDAIHSAIKMYIPSFAQPPHGL